MRTRLVHGSLTGAYGVARLSAQLARENAANEMTLDEIACDALALVQAAARARRAVDRNGNPDRAVNEIRTIAERYGARVIDQRDVNGMAVGLRFASGAYSCGFRNTFFVL